MRLPTMDQLERHAPRAMLAGAIALVCEGLIAAAAPTLAALLASAGAGLLCCGFVILAVIWTRPLHA